MLRRTLLSLALLAASPAFAQTPDPTIHTDTDLQQREAKLLETAKTTPTGLAIGRLEDYGNDYTLLVVRVRTGEAERHQFFADQMVIKTGTLTLITGGTMQGEHPNNGPGRPGETLGSGIEGGKEVILQAGDIVHIPAGIPHWIKLTPSTITTSSSKKSNLPKNLCSSCQAPKTSQTTSNQQHLLGALVPLHQLYLNQAPNRS